MSYSQCMLPEEWIRRTYSILAVDLSVVLRFKYIGSQAAAHVTIAATTGDMTFEQGATTAAADVSTGDNPGTAGVVDISALSTVKDLHTTVNLAADWEAWFEDYLPDNDIEVTAGNAIFLTTLTDQDCTPANGYAVLGDTSLETAEIVPCGVSLEGPSSIIHNSDKQTLHEVLQINATVTFAGATDGLYVYAVDDLAGTKELLVQLPLVSATATEWKNSGEPLYSTKNRRIVFQATDASGAITSPTIIVSVRSKILAPTDQPRKSKSRQ